MEEQRDDEENPCGAAGRKRVDDGTGYGWNLHPSGGGNLVSTVSAAPTSPTVTGMLDLSNYATTSVTDYYTSQGWKWEVNGSEATLTLNNCYIQAGTTALYFPDSIETVVIELYGDNIIEATENTPNSIINNPETDDYSTTTVIRAGSADGKLSILCPDETINYLQAPYGISGDNITIESGSIYSEATIGIISDDFTLSGGSLTIDTSNVTGSTGGGIYTLGSVYIKGGNLSITTGTTIGVWIAGQSPSTLGSENGFFVSGGNVYIKSTTFGFTSEDQNGSTVQFTGGNITFETNTGVVSVNGDIEVSDDVRFTFIDSRTGFDVRGSDNNVIISGGKFDISQASPDFRFGYSASGDIIITAPADYSVIDTLLAQVPSDLSGYNEASVSALQKVLDKVEALDRNLTILDQKTVDFLAAELRAALSNLITLPEEPAEGEEEEETYIPSTPISDGLHEYSLGTMLYQDGKRVKGLYEYEGATYFFNKQGFMQTGWVEFDEGWRYFGEDGKMATGWLKLGNVWYYFDPETGLMLNDGLATIGKDTYYFYDWGGMANDWWYEAEDGWYFFGGSGAMKAAQWLEWKGDWYYLTETGRMAADTDIGGYYVNADGVWVP